MTARTAILGGGALGLTLAYRLARAGEPVVVYEAGPDPGGLAAGFRVGPDGPWLEKFYHHLFGTDHAIVALIRELGLGDKLSWTTPSTSHLVGGKSYRLDGVVPAITFAPLPVPDRLRLLGGLGFLKVWPFPERLEGRTATAWIKRWMGARAYGVAFEPLFAGKFGPYADQVALPWIWSRIHSRTARLGYLRGGFQQLYESLAAAVKAHGGTVRLGTPVREVRQVDDASTVQDGGGRLRVTTAAGNETYDRVVSTLAPRLTYALAPDLPADFTQRYDWSLAYGAFCLILALDRPLMSEVYWLSVADPGYPFGVVVEHTNFQPAAEYGGRHLVYLGKYLPMDHPLMRATKAEALAEMLPHLARINPDFTPDWVTGSWSFAAPYAQPIVTTDYRARIPPRETPVPGLYLANMFQVYPQDRGQNYSVVLANQLAARLLAGPGAGV
ncbi:MAG TPA: NAD(P)/FAD-dependent oxidoreductase [Ktedonobacterales bacterium]